MLYISVKLTYGTQKPIHNNSFGKVALYIFKNNIKGFLVSQLVAKAPELD